jgi:hypothetical protein
MRPTIKPIARKPLIFESSIDPIGFERFERTPD